MNEMAVTVRRRIDSREMVMKDFTPPQLNMFREAVSLEAAALDLSRSQFQEVLGHPRLRGMLRDLLVELGQERPPNADEVCVRLWDKFLGVADARKAFGNLISNRMVRELGDVPDDLLARVKASHSTGETRYLRLFLDPGLSIVNMIRSQGIHARGVYDDPILASFNQPCWRLVDVRSLQDQSVRRTLTMELMGLLSKGISQTGTLKSFPLLRRDAAGRTICISSQQGVQGREVKIVVQDQPRECMTIGVGTASPPILEYRHATSDEIRSAYDREIALEGVTLPDGKKYLSTKINGVVVLVREITWL